MAEENEQSSSSNESTKIASSPNKSGYGKRPMWQWIVIYLVIGGIVYFLIYHFFLAGTAGYNYGSSNNKGSSYSNYK